MSTPQTHAPGVGPAHRLASTLRRALAMLLLPASILPVALLGPALLHAPHQLLHEAATDIHQLAGHSRSREPRSKGER